MRVPNLRTGSVSSSSPSINSELGRGRKLPTVTRLVEWLVGRLASRLQGDTAVYSTHDGDDSAEAQSFPFRKMFVVTPSAAAAATQSQLSRCRRHRRRHANICAAASSTADFEAVIGLETHVQLNTRTKAFCGCANAYGAAPNEHTCPVCLGLPVRRVRVWKARSGVLTNRSALGAVGRASGAQ